jgi:hypothetical protein
MQILLHIPQVVYQSVEPIISVVAPDLPPTPLAGTGGLSHLTQSHIRLVACRVCGFSTPFCDKAAFPILWSEHHVHTDSLY